MTLDLPGRHMHILTKNRFRLMLIAMLLLPTGDTPATAFETLALASSVSGNKTASAANQLPDLNSMATELNSRSAVLETEIVDLGDLPAIQEKLAQMAKVTKHLSRNLKRFKHAAPYSYDALFDVNARIEQQAGDLKEILRTLNEALNQAERLEKDWLEEGLRWKQLKSSLQTQASSQALEPTFVNVRRIVAGSQERIGQAIELLTAQRQVAEVIRASHASLDIELNELVAVLHDNLMRKTARSMFSSKYYAQLRTGFKKELPKHLHRFSMPDLHFFRRWGWRLSIQAAFSILLSVAIFRQRTRLMQRVQWRFIARRPVEVGDTIQGPLSGRHSRAGLAVYIARQRR
jgi:hypothetical protein